MRRIAAAFFLIGLALLCGGGYWVSRTVAFLGRAETAQGVVVRIDVLTWRRSGSTTDTRYQPVVQFQTAAGVVQTIRGEPGSWAKEFAVGDVVEVRYDAARPADGVIPGFGSLWFGPVIILGFGLFFALLGGGPHVAFWAIARRSAELRRTGTRIQALYQGVEKNGSITANGRNPWRIVCHWIDPATGQLHVLESDNLWFDPTTHIDRKEIPVYIDPSNPRRHWVDTSFLPKLSE